MLPEVTVEGRLTEDPTLRFSQSGMPIATLSIAANSRKKVDDEWVDDKVLFLRVTCFKAMAENVCESLTKSDLVIARGRLQTNQWETPEGEKRSMIEMVADSVGPSLAFRTAQLGGGTPRREAPPADQQEAPPIQMEDPPF